DDVALAREPQSAARLVRAQFLLDPRDHLALTNRAAIVWAMVFVGVKAIALAENAELEFFDAQHPIGTVGKVIELAHHHFVHRITPSLAAPILWPRGGTTSAGRRN